MMSNEKRLAAVDQSVANFRAQQNIIRQALSNIVVRKETHVHLDDDSGDLIDTNVFSNKLQLFDADVECDDDVNFDIEPQFHGKEGAELRRLQSTYKNDNRFRLTERFIENQTNDDSGEEIDEKEQQLDILNRVLDGKTTSNICYPDPIEKSVQRYDPNNPKHAYMLLETKCVEPAKKRRAKHVSNVDKPTVSQDQFYTVNDHLAETLKRSATHKFSLLGNFGVKTDDRIIEDCDKQENTNNKAQTSIQNPFKYDSSEDEAHDSEINIKEIRVTLPDKNRKNNYKMFFTENDERIEEGRKMILQIAYRQQSKDEFRANCSTLHHLMKSSISRARKEKRPFKVKINTRQQKLKAFANKRPFTTKMNERQQKLKKFANKRPFTTKMNERQQKLKTLANKRKKNL